MRRPGSLLLVILALGILLASRFEKTEAFIYRRAPLRLSLNEDENEPREFTGRVIDKTLREDGAALTVDAGRESGRVRVFVQTEDILRLPKIGQRVRFRGTPYLFPAAGNPGQFSMRAYADAVGLSCGVRADALKPVSRFFFPLREGLFRIRYFQYQHIQTLAPEEEKEDLLLLVGTGSGEAPFDSASPFTSGVPGLSYLFRFSSSHLSFAALFVYRFLRKYLKREKLSRVLALLCSFLLLLYSGLSGASVRAFLVLLLRFFAMKQKRRFDLVTAGSWSLILMLLIRPSLLFTMSVYAYLPVLFAFGILVPELTGLRRGKRKKSDMLLYPLTAAAAFLPFSLLLDYAACPYAPLLSIILYPLSRISFLLDFSGALVGGRFPGAGKLLLSFAGFLIRISEDLVRLVLKLPLSLIVTGCPGTGRILFYEAILVLLAFGAAWWNHKRKEGGGNFALPTVLAVFIFGLLFLRIPRVPEGEMEIVMIDVGQGDGILIRTRRENFLIDGGSSDEDDLMEYVLRPVLSYYGVHKLDGVFLTHGDEDHLSGTAALIASGYPVKRLYLPDLLEAEEEFSTALQAAEQTSVPVSFLSKGSGGAFSVGTLACLFPEEKSSRTGNASSMVLLFETGTFRALFTGDIGEEEEALIETNGPVDLLKAAHHGSRFSNSTAFLKRTQPRLILISAGHNNPYGHPAEEALLRMHEAGSAFYATNDCGQIVVHVEKSGTFRVRFPVLEKSLLE